MQYGYVCVCNETYCDTLNLILPENHDEFLVISSSSGGLRFDAFTGKFNFPKQKELNSFRIPEVPDGMTSINEPKFHSTNNWLTAFLDFVSLPLGEETVKININSSKKYQTIIGMGGGYSDDVIILVNKMSENLRNQFYQSYFSQTEGIGYTILRISIGVSDSDNEIQEDDLELSTIMEFNQRDCDMINQLNEINNNTNNNDIKLIALASNSPSWMNTNANNFGFGPLKFEYYQMWTDYIMRYLESMRNNNVSIWGISTENEIKYSPNSFIPTTYWHPIFYTMWICKYLGPTLRNSTENEVKLLIGDDQRNGLFVFGIMEQECPEIMEYTNGISIHWHSDSFISPNYVEQVRKIYPNKNFFVTESSICSFDDKNKIGGTRLGRWSHGSIYTDRLIDNFLHGFQGWMDSNLILDEKGDPNFSESFCDAPIVFNEENMEFYKNPIFYSLGHFTKFIIPGSVRIDLSIDSTSIQTIAFLRPDNYVVVIVHNPFHLSSPASIIIRTDDNRTAIIQISSYSLHTVLYKL